MIMDIFKKVVNYLSNSFMSDIFFYNIANIIFIILVFIVYYAYINNVFKKSSEVTNKANATRIQTKVFSDVLLFAQEDYRPAADRRVVRKLPWEEAMERSKRIHAYQKKWYPWRSNATQKMSHGLWFMYIFVSQGNRFLYFFFYFSNTASFFFSYYFYNSFYYFLFFFFFL